MPPVNYGVHAHSIQSLTVNGRQARGGDLHPRKIAKDLVSVTEPGELAMRLHSLRPRTTAAEVLAELAELAGGQAVAAVPYLNAEVARLARAAGILVAAFDASAAIYECWKPGDDADPVAGLFINLVRCAPAPFGVQSVEPPLVEGGDNVTDVVVGGFA